MGILCELLRPPCLAGLVVTPLQDDEDTIKAKIKFANDLGLGGLLIWSVSCSTACISP